MRKVSQAAVDVDIDAITADVREMMEPQLEYLAERVADEARRTSEFADKTGELRRSISAKKSKFEDGGYIVIAKAQHAHLVEFGHVQVTKNGDVVGSVAARPFLRRAKDKVLRTAVREIQARIGGAFDERG